jgi:hypothetical protein
VKSPKLAEHSIHHYLRDRVDDVHALAVHTWWASKNRLTPEITARLNEFSRRIESIQFYTSLCIITIRNEILG